jgi:hypothetical protein
MLKNAYDRGDIQTSEELMEATETKYDELVKTNKWKPSKPKEDPNLIALTATVKTLKDALEAKKSGTNSDSGRQRNSAGGQGSWKFDPSFGSNGTYIRKNEGKDPKTYKWCTGPGHGGKPMWVCGHEPGSCNEKYDRNSSRNSNSSSNDGGANANTGTGGNAEASIQALRAVLEDTDFGDDPNAQIMACLALLRG